MLRALVVGPFFRKLTRSSGDGGIFRLLKPATRALPSRGWRKIRDYPRPLRLTIEAWRTRGAVDVHRTRLKLRAAGRFLPGKGSNFSDSLMATQKNSSSVGKRS